MDKRIRFSVVLMLLVLLQVHAAYAEVFSVRRADGIGRAVAVWERQNGRSYLFLPAYMKDQPLTVLYDRARSVSVEGEVVKNGETTPRICAGASVSANVKGKTRNIVVMESTNLPALHLTTASGTLDSIHRRKGNREKGAIQIITAQGEVAFEGALDYVKGHGNATFTYEKKPYQIKLEKKAALLGMDAAKSYVLLANQHENSLLRNRITFDLARGLGMRFTPECRPVDLYANGEYRGSYLLSDKISVSSGSVDVTDSEEALEFINEAFLEQGGEPERFGKDEYESARFKGVRWPKEPEDLSGGYLFELEYQERYADETSGLVTPRGQPIVVKSPEEMGMQQGWYVYELLAGFERAIFASDGIDPESGKHYTQIADFDSLVRKYMIEEASKNYDGNNSSQYFYKDSDAVNALIYAGPVWDYDSAWGNYAKKGGEEAASAHALSVAQGGYKYSWWPALYRQEDFSAEVHRVYEAELRPMLEVLTGMREPWEGCAVKRIETYVQELSASAEMNFARWRIFNSNSRAIKTGENYVQNIEYLKNWIVERIQFLDENW